MDIYKFGFTGEAAYINALPDIRKVLSPLMDENFQYECGIKEATQNAARYSIVGKDTVPIHIEIRRTEYDITTRIAAPTHPFDAESYRNSLNALLEDERWRNANWQDYTREKDKRIGFWLMLSGCDYLYVKSDGQEVSLCIRIPFPSHAVTSKISNLVPRFFIEKDGVIF